MGISDLFRKKKKEPELDSLHDLVLSKMKPGCFVDYDLETWEVTRYNTYDWGDGMITEEWELRNGDEVRYLDKEEDDEVEWSLSRKIPFGKFDPDGSIARHIIEKEDPPGQVPYEGETYYLEESGGGFFRRDGKGPGKEFLRWDYLSDKAGAFLTTEQWGEEDFEAVAGMAVEEYQFINILPPGQPQ